MMAVTLAYLQWWLSHWLTYSDGCHTGLLTVRNFFRSPCGRYSNTIQGAGTSGPAVRVESTAQPQLGPYHPVWCMGGQGGLEMKSKLQANTNQPVNCYRFIWQGLTFGDEAVQPDDIGVHHICHSAHLPHKVLRLLLGCVSSNGLHGNLHLCANLHVGFVHLTKLTWEQFSIGQCMNSTQRHWANYIHTIALSWSVRGSGVGVCVGGVHVGD